MAIRTSWEAPEGLSDAMEVRAAVLLNAPMVCALVVFVGGLLLGLLGRTAAKDRAALAASQS